MKKSPYWYEIKVVARSEFLQHANGLLEKVTRYYGFAECGGDQWMRMDRRPYKTYAAAMRAAKDQRRRAVASAEAGLKTV